MKNVTWNRREKLYIVHRKQLKGKETQNQARMMINLKSHKALLLSSGGAKVREIGRHVTQEAHHVVL